MTKTGLLIDGDDYYRAFYQAASQARSYVLLAGWQFDTDACLLRGAEAEAAHLPVALAQFLRALCEANDQLHVYILAWDFHPVFALERQWMQQLRFNWTSERVTFVFDQSHVDNGSHHQKFVVIDGQVAFLGGLDLCDHRWDDRSHKDPNPLRLSRGTPHQPFHDVQAYVAGVEAAQHLTALFMSRWSQAGGDSLTLPPAATASPDQDPAGLVPLAASTIFLSRTDPSGSPTGTTDCREIYELYARAISSAERLIYIETQYFSSREVGAALVERLSKASASPLDVVIVLNMQGETPKEQIAVGLAQAKIIGSLREAAKHSGHRLGIYYTVPHTDGTQEPERATYIHSKIAIVDDRFLTVGSANLTNRSMSVDTELNLSVETANNDDALASSIARARQSLIAEHLGVESDPAQANLVATLDDLASRRQGRLRLHPSPTDEERAALEVIDPQQLPFDPAAVEDHDHRRSIFVGGLSALWKRLAGEGA